MKMYKILVFFLAFSFLLSVLTASRNLKEISGAKAPQEFQDEVLMDLSEVWERVLEEKSELMLRGRGRLNIEINDYSGTGANTHHDPKPPGSSG